MTKDAIHEEHNEAMNSKIKRLEMDNGHLKKQVDNLKELNHKVHSPPKQRQDVCTPLTCSPPITPRQPKTRHHSPDPLSQLQQLEERNQEYQLTTSNKQSEITRLADEIILGVSSTNLLDSSIIVTFNTI